MALNLASCVASGTTEKQGFKFLFFTSRYFKRDEKSHNIRTYVYKCSRGDWFVLYQLSKNLNRPFFMDFLKELTRQVKPGTEDSVENGEFYDRSVLIRCKNYGTGKAFERPRE